MAANSLLLLSLWIIFLSGSSMIIQISGSSGLGINYGRIGNNLPSPDKTVHLLQKLNISRVKLYDADPTVLSAFAGTNFELVIMIGNSDLHSLSNSQQYAESWVQKNVQLYNNTKISTIIVGNEVFASEDPLIMSSLLPAMKSIREALDNLGLSSVVVTSAHALSILSTSFPPSSGTFASNLDRYISPLLEFHFKTNSSFLINAYPFFAYKDRSQNVSLSYVMFEPNQGIVDTGSGSKLLYDNMLFAQIDAVYAAMKKLKYDNIKVKVSETGWPSAGDSSEYGASVENAATYNGNLLGKVMSKARTPMKPDTPIDVFIFALFNENQKPGAASERNYGLLYANGTPVYELVGSSKSQQTGSPQGSPEGSFLEVSKAHGLRGRGVAMGVLIIWLRVVCGAKFC